MDQRRQAAGGFLSRLGESQFGIRYREGGDVKYYISTGYLDTRETVEIARAADELGFDGLGIPDHVVNLETLATPYPYSRDGTRRWEPFTDWPDPWVLIGSLAQCTQRLRFVTTVYVAALRDPYSAAKSIGTAALLADGRVELGLGVGWCAEEFELLDARFDRRGRRTEEMIELMRALWSPGWTEFDGEFYRTPRLEMSPTPPPIPVWVGGLTDIALRRAARYDGWVGDLITTDDAIAVAQRLRNYRDEHQSLDREFAVLAPLIDALTPADYERAERGGVTHILTMPWMFHSGPNATLAEKVDDMKRFRDDLGLDAQR
jgi:probable F420-dependent oxidoreductase